MNFHRSNMLAHVLLLAAFTVPHIAAYSTMKVAISGPEKLVLAAKPIRDNETMLLTTDTLEKNNDDEEDNNIIDDLKDSSIENVNSVSFELPMNISQPDEVSSTLEQQIRASVKNQIRVDQNFDSSVIGALEDIADPGVRKIVLPRNAINVLNADEGPTTEIALDLTGITDTTNSMAETTNEPLHNLQNSHSELQVTVASEVFPVEADLKKTTENFNSFQEETTFQDNQNDETTPYVVEPEILKPTNNFRSDLNEEDDKSTETPLPSSNELSTDPSFTVMQESRSTEPKSDVEKIEANNKQEPNNHFEETSVQPTEHVDNPSRTSLYAKDSKEFFPTTPYDAPTTETTYLASTDYVTEITHELSVPLENENEISEKELDDEPSKQHQPMNTTTISSAKVVPQSNITLHKSSMETKEYHVMDELPIIINDTVLVITSTIVPEYVETSTAQSTAQEVDLDSNSIPLRNHSSKPHLVHIDLTNVTNNDEIVLQKNLPSSGRISNSRNSLVNENTEKESSMVEKKLLPINSITEKGYASPDLAFLPKAAGRNFDENVVAETSSHSDISDRSPNNRMFTAIVISSLTVLAFFVFSAMLFLRSFHRQHGVLDIEMQEHRHGKDNLDEEEPETRMKLLNPSMPPPIFDNDE